MEHIVYVKINEKRYITSVDSSAFLTDLTDWIEIDRGNGDKYYHAQGNYVEKPIMTMGGAYQYRLTEDDKPVECTAEEIAAQEEALKPVNPTPTLENRVETLETDTADLAEAMDMLLSGVTE